MHVHYSSTALILTYLKLVFIIYSITIIGNKNLIIKTLQYKLFNLARTAGLDDKMTRASSTISSDKINKSLAGNFHTCMF